MSATERAIVAALAGLPAMYPARLRALIVGRAVAETWEMVCAGRAADIDPLRTMVRRGVAELSSSWAVAARRVDLDAIERSHRAEDVTVLLAADPDYPPALAADIDAPAVLFRRGDPAHLLLPAVAIVGTRRCTYAGREIARWLGRQVCDAGAAVVSGLALGIDGAAHTGALQSSAGGVVGVVGSGLDVPYPRRHRDLWAAVAARGVMVSEAPLGAAPAGWRFPARNRIIAALASVVVVAESHAHGGSLVTARLAGDRGKAVLAVPGSIRSPASAGTNALLRDGAAPLLDLDDLSVAMSLAGTPLPGNAGGDQAEGATVAANGAEEQRVLDAVAFEAVSTETVIVRSGLPPREAVVALRRLEAAGQLVSTSGGWWERA